MSDETRGRGADDGKRPGHGGDADGQHDHHLDRDDGEVDGADDGEAAAEPEAAEPPGGGCGETGEASGLGHQQDEPRLSTRDGGKASVWVRQTDGAASHRLRPVISGVSSSHCHC